MDEISKVKVVYGNEEFEISEQELDRITTIASKRLRNELIGMKLGFGMPIKKNELRNESDIKVLKNGYESEFYKAMAEPLIYAIESGDLDNYSVLSNGQKIVMPAIENARIDRKAIGELNKLKTESVHELFAREMHKMLAMGNKRDILLY